jgi:hypothetical protein
MVGRHYISYVAPLLRYIILVDLASPFKKMKLGEYQPNLRYPDASIKVLKLQDDI